MNFKNSLLDMLNKTSIMQVYETLWTYISISTTLSLFFTILLFFWLGLFFHVMGTCVILYFYKV